MKSNSGFTLIELMVVVVIVGVLASIAIPNYTDYITRSRIPDAVSALSDAKVRMEQYFQDNRFYNTDGSNSTTCGVTISNPPNYSLSCVASNNGQAFVWTATGSGTMAGFSFTIDQSNARSSSTTAAAKWPSLTGTGCWISKKQGC